MSETDDTTIRTLTAAMVWSDVHARGWRLVAFPVVLGLAFLGINIGMSQVPGAFTGQTVETLQRFADQYFTGVEEGQSLVLAALLIQGPYFLALLASILAVFATTSGTGGRIRRGELELLLSAPYSAREVFLSLILSSLLITLVEILILGAISLGGVAVALSTMDVALRQDVIQLASLAFLVPLPLALWATLVAVFTLFRYPDASLHGMGVDNPLLLLAVAPAILLLMLMMSYRGFNPMLGTLVALVVPTIAVGIGIATIDRWFHPRRVIGF